MSDMPDDPARRPDHRHHAARRQPRDGPPVHRGAGPGDGARAGRRRRRGHRGHPRRRARRVVVQLRLQPRGRDQADLRRRATRPPRPRSRCCWCPASARWTDLQRAHDAGASVARIATHCTEADVSIQHFGLARSLGMETVGFLMMAHKTPPEELAKQARIMVDAGAQCVYCVDSAGALRARRRAGAGRGDGRRGRRAGAGRVPRPPEPVAGRGQLGAGLQQRRPADRRRAVRAGRRRGQLADRGARRDVRPAGHRHRRRRRRACSPRPRRWSSRSCRAGRRWTATRSCRATRGSTPASCCTPSAPPSATASRPTTSWRKVGELGYVGGQEDMIIDVAIELAEEKGRRMTEFVPHVIDGKESPRPTARRSTTSTRGPGRAVGAGGAGRCRRGRPRGRRRPARRSTRARGRGWGSPSAARCMHRLADLISRARRRAGRWPTPATWASRSSDAKGRDVPRTAQNFRFFADHARLAMAETLPMDTGHHAYTRYEPAGVVAAIAPWNFPLMLESWKVAPALAWGNTVVLKPAEDSPRVGDDPGPARAGGRHPARRAQRGARLRAGLGRRGADRGPARRPDHVHRRVRDRPGRSPPRRRATSRR